MKALDWFIGTMAVAGGAIAAVVLAVLCVVLVAMPYILIGGGLYGGWWLMQGLLA